MPVSYVDLYRIMLFMYRYSEKYNGDIVTDKIVALKVAFCRYITHSQMYDIEQEVWRILDSLEA